MKKVLVIGGTSGIGEGISDIFIEKKYKVGITGVEKEAIAKLDILGNENIITRYLDCIKEDNTTIIEELVTQMGGLDILVFSAGIGNLNKDLGYTVENKANELNVLAFTEIVDWSYRFFDKQGSGHLVAVTSLSGLFGSRVAPAYHAAKAYQISYLEGLRQKAKRSKKPIYITDARPGFVDTPMTKDKGKKMIWVASKEVAAKQIVSLIRRKKGHGYITKRWRIAAIIVKVLPRFLRDRM